MHDIEIVFHDDSTPSIVVGELKGDLCIRSMKNDTSHGVNVGSIGGEVIGDTVDSKAHNLLQQAVDVTKAPLIMVANKAKDGLNKLTKQNNDTNSPAQSNKTVLDTNNNDLRIDISNEDDQGGATSNGYSRRLVEYFVVVSSIPKLIENKGKNESNHHVHAGEESIPGDDLKQLTQKQIPQKPITMDVDVANQHEPPPAPSSHTTGSKITPRVSARVDKRWGHLKESFCPGESILPDLNPSKNVVNVSDDLKPLEENNITISSRIPTSSDATIHKESVKANGKLCASMTEQKKKFREQKKRFQQQLGAKMKSISFGRSFSGDIDDTRQQQENGDDSSFSSFSNEEASLSGVLPSVAFQPSQSPSMQKRCLTPTSTDRKGEASENIRIDESFLLSTHREYNNDIEDCVLKPVITAQYPPIDRPDIPLNPMLTHFCHPQGVENIIPIHEYKMPKIHHFVLTDAKGEKLYGTCLTVYEEIHFDIDGKQGTADDDDVSLASTRDDDQDRSYVECSINGPPIVRRHRRRSTNHKYYAPRVLCLLSTWPYLSSFRTYLTQLYRLATTTTLMTAPLERYILNICEEVPAPPPGSFEVQLSILEDNIRIWAPPADQPIPYVSVNYGVLFECLDISNVLFAWNTLACERKILLVSSQLSLLTVCSEILCSMIFPMRWSHLYIPVLPRFLTPMLDAPMPYLCGISRENFPYAVADISDETVVIDLDRNLITMGTTTPDLPILPQRRKLKLEAALEKHAGQVFWKARGLTKASIEAARLSKDENAIDKMLRRANAVWDEQLGVMDEAFYLAHSPDSMSMLYDTDDIPQKQSRWDAVQEAFLRFYVAMLKDYRKYLPSTNTEQNSWRASMLTNGSTNDPRFLVDEFVASQRLDFQPFLEELCSTQQFDDFITRRIYNAGKAPDVTFFDQSIDAKKNRSKLRLKKTETSFLHSANAHRIMKQIDAIEPNKNDLPTDGSSEYFYPNWPESFDESLFGIPRPIPNIISAEFDRRAALSRMLKEKHGDIEDSRLSGCFNPSPEATTFVMFFVMFNQVIGRDWDSFRKKHGNMLDDGFNLKAPNSGYEASVQPAPRKPAFSPPWMTGESFHTLHSNLRPEDTRTKDEGNEVSSGDPFFIPDCDNFCTDKPLDPSTYIGMPWVKNEISSMTNCKVTNSPAGEQFENELIKTRSVAKAQVDLGVNTLKMMRLRKLASEAITYKSLIEACGRCGIAHRAAQLLEMMTQDGLALDSEVYYCFMKAFARNGDIDATLSSHNTDTMSEISASAPSAVSGISSSDPTIVRRTSYESKATLGSMLTKHSSKFLGEINHVMTSSLEENRRAFKTARRKRNNRLSKQSLTKEKDVIVTNAIKTHLDLSNCILEDLYPGLSIDTGSDTCPKCSCVLNQDSIITGWKPCEVQDFSTTCPSCKHPFVPKFSIACSLETFEGSQGEGTTLFVDYLSPWVLLRQIKNIITPLGIDNTEDIEKSLGVESIIDPKFREGSGINATLWWNIIVAFRRFKIPYTFLLQGNFPDQQLIMPTLDDV